MSLFQQFQRFIKGRISSESASQARSQHFLSDIFGHKMYVDVNDLGIDLQSISGLSEKLFPYGELGFWRNNLKTGQTVIDIGANIGYFTLFMARLVGPSGKVFAIEPGPMSHALLTKNVAINGYKHVRVDNMAVADTNGMTTLMICRTGETDNRIASVIEKGSSEIRDAIEVTVTRLDDYLQSKSVAKVDFIKMDVQGAEFLAFKGMEKTLTANKTIQMLLEYSPGSLTAVGVQPSDFLKLIRSYGFRIYILPESKEMFEATDSDLLEQYGPNRISHTNLILRR